jgi:hypothetical protein
MGSPELPLPAPASFCAVELIGARLVVVLVGATLDRGTAVGKLIDRVGGGDGGAMLGRAVLDVGRPVELTVGFDVVGRAVGVVVLTGGSEVGRAVGWVALGATVGATVGDTVGKDVGLDEGAVVVPTLVGGADDGVIETGAVDVRATVEGSTLGVGVGAGLGVPAGGEDGGLVVVGGAGATDGVPVAIAQRNQPSLTVLKSVDHEITPPAIAWVPLGSPCPPQYLFNPMVSAS